MEGTFASAKNQYKSNYVQHVLTGEEKYKTAYESAEKTMQSILSQAPPEEPEKLKPFIRPQVRRVSHLRGGNTGR